MDSSDQLSIAQRRTKRRCSALSSPAIEKDGASALKIDVTPSKPRSKRVRFSDPSGTTTRTPSATSTGLTPFVHKASINNTPSRRASTQATSSRFLDHGEIQFTPYKQVLDDRFKRRLRRHGLSEVTNKYESDLKSKEKLQKDIMTKDKELRRLRIELEAAKSKNNESNVVALASSQKVVEEVESELAELRQSFSGHPIVQEDATDTDWGHVERSTGPGSEGGDTINIWEDDIDLPLISDQQTDNTVDPDLLAMAVDLEAAKSEKNRLLSSSFRSQSSNSNCNNLDFADSPARQQPASLFRTLPNPSKDFYQNISKSLKDTTRRAEDAELALAAFAAEIKSLGFGGETGSDVLNEIGAQLRIARLELERLLPGETESGFESAKVLPEIMKKLNMLVRQVREKDGELKSLREQERTLRGNFEHALVASEKASQRVTSLEMELDHGVEEMLEVRMRSQKLEREVTEQNDNSVKLIAALNKYRDDVENLDKLIERIEAEQLKKISETETAFEERISDLDAQVAAEQTGRRAAESSAVERLRKIKDLELAMALAQKHTCDVEVQLANLKSQLGRESTEHSSNLGALNTRISNLSTALASANAEVDKLKAKKIQLEERVQTEEKNGVEAVDAMQHYFLKGLARATEQKKRYVNRVKIRSANWDLENDEDGDGSSSAGDPMTPRSLSRVRFLDAEGEDEADDHVEGRVEVTRGKGRGESGRLKTKNLRRRTDSGIGMDSVLEDGEADDGGLMTPELSSEADYDLEL